MRRYITREDKKILDNNSDRILSFMISGKTGFSFVALAIGSAIGGISGMIVAFGVIGQNNRYSMLAFFTLFLLFTIMVPLYTSIIGTRNKRNKLFQVGKTMINGATCVIDPKTGNWAYIEDDFVDDNGNPYMMVLSGLWTPPTEGQRFILVNTGETTFLMSYWGELRTLVPENTPQKVAMESAFVGHQNMIEKTNDPNADNDRIRKFFKNYRNTYRYRRSLALLATGFFGFCGLTIIVFGGYGLFFEGTSLEDRYFPVALPSLFFLTIIAIDVCTRIFDHVIKKRYRNITSVKKVVLVNTIVSFGNDRSRSFTVTETDDNGVSNTRTYYTTGFDCGDASKMKPGQTIYKYTFGNGEFFFGTK